MQEAKKHISRSSFILILAVMGNFAFGQNIKSLVSPLDLVMPLPKSDTTLFTAPVSMLNPIVYSVSKLPIFCKIEHKLGKNAGYNLKMRLGDIDYVDRLEGKGTPKLP